MVRDNRSVRRYRRQGPRDLLLLLAWVALSHWRAERSAAAILGGLAFILALFVCVLLHEFGHALTARRYGVRTRDIILLPIGGVARLERIPEKPRQELWIALAGPAVNVVIAVALAVWLQVTGGWQPVEELTVTGGSFVERLLVVNIFLVVFNLIPAFPMDGGRVLRALLGLKLDYVRATQIAASIGQALALGFGFLGLFSNPFLVFIALFVWIGAGPGGEPGADEERPRRHPGAAGDDHRLPHPGTCRHPRRRGRAHPRRPRRRTSRC